MKKYVFCRILLALLFLFPIYSSAIAQYTKYKKTKIIQYNVSGFIKDNKNEKPLSGFVVELFLKDDLSMALVTTFTNYQGKFNFSLPKGNYMIIIKSREYEEQLIPLQITDWDINLKDILLRRIYD